MARSGWWMAHRVLLFALVAVTAALVGYGVTVSVRGKDQPAPPPSITLPAAVTQVLAAPPPIGGAKQVAPTPTESGVAHALAGPVSAAALGGRLLAHVVDVQSGTVLYDRSGSTPAAPASTAKLMTAAAILTVHAPTDRLTTTVVAGAQPGTVVLVGGGDPTLTGAAPGKAAAYPGAARVSALAAQLKAKHVRVSSIVVDSSLFRGPAISPDWDPADVPTNYGGAITALMVDGGRALPTDSIRSTTPDVAAGKALAARLGHPDLPVRTGRAPAGASRLAAVASAPVSTLVEDMLQESDNVIADVLARDVAVADHATPSFLGAAAAIRDVLARLHVQVGSGMRDGSGLAADDRVSPTALTGVLRLIAGAGSASGPRSVYDALPVAGWSGTLEDRYGSGSALSAAGRVRAKTGTLTGVSSLAGLVRDRSGRLLAFSLDADRAPPGGSYGADAALDVVAAALAQCGCG